MRQQEPPGAPAMQTEESSSGTPGPRGNISRRALIGGLAASALAGPALARRPKPVRRRDDDALDVAIVGAGVSGCYAAWRLSARAGSPTRIEIFERSDRIGGRLLSIKPDGMTSQIAELGGMRIASTQTPLLNLVKQLGLELELFPPTVATDLYYLRGIRTRAGELRCSPEFGYRPRAELLGKTPDEVFKHLLGTVTGRVDWTREAFDKARNSLTYQGRPLYDLPYEYVFLNVLGTEGARFIAETTGYGRPNIQDLAFMEEAALDMFISEFHHVRGGYDQVPHTLAKRAMGRGVGLTFGASLRDVRFDDGGLVRLAFEMADGTARVVQAKSAVLAIPDSAYGLLDGDGPLRRANGLTRMLGGLAHVEAMKTYCSFETQWWRPLGIDRGRSITDLPMRQCFYLPDPSGRGVTLSPYVSGRRAVGFWTGIAEPIRDHQLDPNGLAGREIVRQLGELHGIDVPRPTQIHSRLFDGGHVGYGWNMWRPGVRSWEIVSGGRKPFADRPIYCIGQATASFQGWVMGTLGSTEAVLRRHFGLSRPDWWPADFPL